MLLTGLSNYTLLSKQFYREKDILDFKVQYFILEGMISDTYSDERKTYGLCVEKFNGIKIESKIAEDITCSYEKINRFAELLSEGDVTPLTFSDVVDDLIVE